MDLIDKYLLKERISIDATEWDEKEAKKQEKAWKDLSSKMKKEIMKIDKATPMISKTPPVWWRKMMEVLRIL